MYKKGGGSLNTNIDNGKNYILTIRFYGIIEK